MVTATHKGREVSHPSPAKLKPSKAYSTMAADLKRASKHHSLIARNAESDPRPIKEVIASSWLFNL